MGSALPQGDMDPMAALQMRRGGRPVLAGLLVTAPTIPSSYRREQDDPAAGGYAASSADRPTADGGPPSEAARSPRR